MAVSLRPGCNAEQVPDQCGYIARPCLKEEKKGERRERGRDSKIVQWIKKLVVKPDGLSSIPSSHRIEGENQLPEVIR